MASRQKSIANLRIIKIIKKKVRITLNSRLIDVVHVVNNCADWPAKASLSLGLCGRLRDSHFKQWQALHGRSKEDLCSCERPQELLLLIRMSISISDWLSITSIAELGLLFLRCTLRSSANSVAPYLPQWYGS